MHEIDIDQLREITGGAAPKPALPAPTFHPPAGMAPPKYSAGWWDLVRARGLPL